MEESYLSLDELYLKGAVRLQHILECKIEKSVGTYSKMTLTGIVFEEDSENFLTQIASDSLLSLCDSFDNIFFTGPISRVEQFKLEGVSYATIRCLSSASVMDRIEKNRSYPKDLSYEAIIKSVGSDYEGFALIGDDALALKESNKVLQYGQTDFEFIKQLASQLELPLIVEDTQDKPRFFIGNDIGRMPLEIESPPAHRTSSAESAYIKSYKIEHVKNLPIGMALTHNGHSYLVTEAVHTLKNGRLVNTYTLIDGKKHLIKARENKKVPGLGLKGKVIEAKGVEVKIHLAIDDNEISNWYPYSPRGGSSIYHLPRAGDTVTLHYLSSREGDAVVTYSKDEVKKHSLSPSTKFWSSGKGQTIRFTPSKLELKHSHAILKENSEITLSPDEGLKLKSPLKIHLQCTGLLSLKSKAISFTALEGIYLNCSKECLVNPATLFDRRLTLSPSSAQLSPSKNTLLHGRKRMSYPFEQEAVPTLYAPIEEKKDSIFGNVLMGLGLAVLAVAVVAITVTTCGAAAPVIAGLVGSGSLVMTALGIGMGVGMAIGGGASIVGATAIADAGLKTAFGDHEGGQASLNQGLAYVTGGFGVMMMTMSYGMAAIPAAQYLDMRYPNYFNVSSNGLAFHRYGSGSPVSNSRGYGYRNSKVQAVYAKNYYTEGDTTIVVKTGPVTPSPPRLQAPISSAMVPAPGPNSVMPYGTNTVFMPTRSMNALLPINTLVPTGFIPYSENIMPPQVLLPEPVLRLPEPKPQDLLKLNEYLPDEGASVEELVESGNPLVEGTGEIVTNISDNMVEKILYGARKAEGKNALIGGHSSQILEHSNYAVEVVAKNADGSQKVKFVTLFVDGNVSKIKTSTLFPDTWTDKDIIDAIKNVGSTPAIGKRIRDGATLHRQIIDGVQVEVIKNGSDVVSGYPTGGGVTELLNGFE